MLLTWIVPVLAFASGGANADLSSEPNPVAIYGGGPAPQCTWPTTVSLGSCTATLVHPQVIVYAAHCGSNYNNVFFGNDTGQQGRSVSTSFCRTNPGFGNLGNGNDWAFCVLAEEVTDIPITPPLMGCETELLKPGASVHMVGFGNNDDGGYGRKYHAQATLNQITSGNEANIGGNGTGVTICNGDSGGPAFIQLPESEGFDGSWRAFGIASWIYTPCGNEGFHTLMHTGMEWIESEAGIDITPCHDADGTWNPGPDCRGFANDPLLSQGEWNTCEFAEVSQWSTACGASYPELTDSAPPAVRIASHLDGETVDMDGGLAELVVSVEATDADGSGIKDVQLIVDGAAVGTPDITEPYEFMLTLPEGPHALAAVAIDHADNSAEAEVVTIDVRPSDAPDPSGGGDDDDGAGGTAGDDGIGLDSGEGSDGSGVEPLDAALPAAYGSDVAQGCACQAQRRPATHRWPWSLVLAIGVVGLRRRL